MVSPFCFYSWLVPVWGSKDDAVEIMPGVVVVVCKGTLYGLYNTTAPMYSSIPVNLVDNWIVQSQHYLR